MVDVDVLSHGFRTRQFVLATPTTPGHIDLRLGVSMEEPWGDRRFASLLPRRRIAEALTRLFIGPYVRDVEQDSRIWQHKQYVPQPALAAGDGPVGSIGSGRGSSTRGVRAERGERASGMDGRRAASHDVLFVVFLTFKRSGLRQKPCCG